ncbi:MAG: iron-sulfur cluster assembly accessory protein [Betaproteobacteria bacterium]|nr:iron-sulfur cluster assembly accessory protein [Betaproteobacteria bacterium]
MITITPLAAKEILASAAESDSEGMALRLAARFAADGSIEYAMGFDDRSPDDMMVKSEGVVLLIHENHLDLLTGATLDFAEISPGEMGFVFKNPNAPNLSGGCGSGGCGGGGSCGSSGGGSKHQGGCH